MSTSIELVLQEIRYYIKWLARGFAPGDWASVDRGRGFTFEGTRPYEEDPDFTRINWPASLLGEEDELVVSVYTQEKAIDVCVLGNLCPSMAFGSEKSKIKRLALLAALFSYSAFRRKDRFRFIGYTDEAELGFPRPRDRSYPLQLAKAILDFNWHGKSRGGLQQATSQLPKQRSLVVIISDFFGITTGLEKALRRVAPRHDAVPIVLWDKREIELPSLPDSLPRLLRWLPWPLPLRDLETGELKYVLLTRKTKEAHRRNIEEQRSRIRAAFGHFGIEPFFFTEVTEGDLKALIKLFLRRRERF